MASSKIKVFFDADVLLSWLTEEEETDTGRNLWSAPYRILKDAESHDIELHSSFITLMEIRYVLRRKKDVSNSKIEEVVEDIKQNFSLEIPDSMDIIEANKMQSEMPLDPFDSLYLSMTETLSADFILTRDQDFQKIIKDSDTDTRALEPEEFVENQM
jgi:predicted nucleic acid-binding protein